MMKLIKYELYRNKLFLALTAIITIVLGAAAIPIAIKGNPEFGFNYIIPLLVMMLLIYGIGIGMIIFMIMQQRELWNRNGILLYSLPVSRFKIFASKIITGLLSTVVLFGIIASYIAIYINILGGNDVIKDLMSYVPTNLITMSALSAVGSWLYWIMTIITLIVLSKTVFSHSKNKGLFIALIGVGLIIILPLLVALLANASFINASIEASLNPQFTDEMEMNLVMDNQLSLWVSIAFNWIMSIGMFVTCGNFIKKRLNI